MGITATGMSTIRPSFRGGGPRSSPRDFRASRRSSHEARSQLNDESPPVRGSSFSYVLPLAAHEPVVDPEFDAYLATIEAKCELIVVDGSPANAFEVNHRRWSKHLHVSVRTATPMGKVGNVLTGVSLATHDRIVIADDDVRFGSELFDLVERLDSADVVRPQTTSPRFLGTPCGTRDARYSIERQLAIGLALSPSGAMCSSGPAVTRATLCLRISNW